MARMRGGDIGVAFHGQLAIIGWLEESEKAYNELKNSINLFKSFKEGNDLVIILN